MLVYGENFKKSMSAEPKGRWPWNLVPSLQKADDLETWYLALCTTVLPILCKWWPYADLNLFYSKVKFSSLSFSVEKCHLSPITCVDGQLNTEMKGICKCMVTKGQGHFMTLVKGHWDFNVKNVYFSETKRLIEIRFHMEHLWFGGRKFI